jgi:hypothetical protein
MEIELDIHGMTIIESKVYLTQMLDAISNDYDEMVVVHGHHGRILLNFVRNEFHHKRINRKMLSLNPGQTIFLLNKL